MATSNTVAGPGKRLYNPLGNFSSYTYQLTLYMITPEAYNAFIESGRQNINISSAKNKTGTYLIAQSGGINNTTSTRATGFELDYYIDDLKIKGYTNAKSNGTSSNTTELSFQIYEPYGFSFITNLKKAQAELQKISTATGYKDVANASRNLFIVGIRFQGYDQSGKVVTSKDVFAQTLNTDSETSGVFEQFYEITLTSIKFKIDGKMTVYSIVGATIAPNTALGVKKGRINNDITLTARNVGEALVGSKFSGASSKVVGLIDELNKKQQELASTKGADGKPGCEIPNTYSLEFIGPDGDKDLIPLSSILSKADMDKIKSPMTTIKKSSESNPGSAEKALPDLTLKTIKITKDTSVMQAISNVIKQSQYLTNALAVIYESSLDENQKAEKDSPTVTPLSWYNLGAVVKNLGWDSIVSDFAYDIKYVIQPYRTPATTSPYAKLNSKYPGPHKRYEYWYTGKNSEVISYEHVLNNAFFNPTVTPSGTKDSQQGNQNVPTVGNKPTNADPTSKLDKGSQAAGSYVTNLTDPGSYVTAKISILGDPDFLMRDSPDSVNSVYNQYYGSDGFTINPNGGEVFIEMKFNEGKDYNNTTGLMVTNTSILFWDYPAPIQELLKGYISYMLLSVVSTFSKGKFTQELTCNINSFPSTSVPTSTNTASAAQIAREAESELPREGNRTSSALPSSAANSNLGFTPDTAITPGTGAVSGSTASTTEIEN